MGRIWKPCKYCGHEPRLDNNGMQEPWLRGYMVSCVNPSCHKSPHTEWQTAAYDATKAWNNDEVVILEEPEDLISFPDPPEGVK